MKLIIYGATELGSLIATQFFEDHDVTIIDKEENLHTKCSNLDLAFVTGSASDVEVLKQADIKNSDVFLACTNNDEKNIVACLTAKKLSGIKTICIVNKDEYKNTLTNRESDYFCSDVYIDYVVWPEELLTQEIFRIITVAQALDVENFADGKSKLLEFKLEKESVLVGKKIRDCAFPPESIIVGITRNSALFIPTGETVFEENDKVIFMGLHSSLDKIAGQFFHKKDFVKSVAIIGGGRVGLMLAKSLEEMKIKTKLIEKDYVRCEKLAQELNSTLVLHSDGTNLALLNEESIGESDVVVSVTNNDEKNLLCSLLAKQLGVKRVISKVSQNINIPLFEKVGIDVAVSANNAALNEIKNDLYETNVDIIATVEQGQGEVLEIIVPDDFLPVLVKDLKLPARAILGTIQRRNRVIIPNGNSQIMPKDNLIIFTTNTGAESIKDFFKGI